ncbi:MAG: MotA/TolQ/ExbB proton channel family protein [Planctomycetota bacterium]
MTQSEEPQRNGNRTGRRAGNGQRAGQGKRTAKRESFTQALPQVMFVGGLCSAVFFGLIALGPLDYPVLRRYCTSHPVAIACVCLFFTGLTTLVSKWYFSFSQSTALPKAASALRQILKEGKQVEHHQRSRWLEANWNSLAASVRNSWFGTRLDALLELQISRGKRHQLESDLDSLALAESDRQHDSYGLLRIINWAMPMLGFLGTVLGISQTLGQLDTELLATQQQAAMNELTAGLYVAFDTTAIALILTVALMFLQFGVSRMELRVVEQINEIQKRELVPFLGVDPYDAQATLLAPVRDMTESLVSTISKLVEQQVALWQSSMTESQKQWTDWTSRAAEAMETSVGHTIGNALTKHADTLKELQDEAHGHLDTRWQQWQTTLSEQARTLQSQQKELAEHGETLCSVLTQTERLVESTTDLKRLEETIAERVDHLENAGRIEDATQTLGEAIAYLGTSLERSGVLRGAPIRPRNKTRTDADGTATATNAEKQSPTSGVASTRKAA